MKLWKKGHDVDSLIEKFTVGNDHILDAALVGYDCKASLAHAKMLAQIGVLNKNEISQLSEGLREIGRLASIGEFVIKQEDEDCHTAIENYLTEHFGEVGKKIHTGRSRNDQVLTALRLYEKEELSQIRDAAKALRDAISKRIKESGNIPLPGYTHMQKAMPSSVGMLFGAYQSALEDDLQMIDDALKIIDKSPLGSAAGYGVPALDIDRRLTARLLGFSGVIENPIYCQNSRGKFETLLIDCLCHILMDLNKMASDLILFSMAEFGFFSLPEELCTGSSIMPQKKNPDVLELVRAQYSIVIGYSVQVKSLYGGLISGYNRDMQLSKEPVMRSIDTAKLCLHVIELVFSKLRINKEACKKAMSQELYATEEAYKLVKKGMPFREAYRQIGKKFS